jgi:hypothetical protein
MDWVKLALEYLKVFLSGQVVIGIVVIVFIAKFKAEIRGLLDRIATIKFPGGELTTSQIAREREELPSTGSQPQPLREPAVVAPNSTPVSIEVHAANLEQQVSAERARAALWEYRYLNYFLARGTQVVLDWLAGLPVNTTVSMFDSFWLPVIPAVVERKAIIDALQAHWLILIDNDVIEVSPKGREYLAWRGPLPHAPSPVRIN